MLSVGTLVRIYPVHENGEFGGLNGVYTEFDDFAQEGDFYGIDFPELGTAFFRREDFEIEEKTMKTCGCGKTFQVSGGWNNYNRVLRCQDCESRRAELLVAIHVAMEGKLIETIYVASSKYHLLDVRDFPVELARRSDDKMNGCDFEIVLVEEQMEQQEELDYTVRLPAPWTPEELDAFQGHSWVQKRTWNFSYGENPFSEQLMIFNPGELKKAMVIFPTEGEQQIVSREIYRDGVLYATAYTNDAAPEDVLAEAKRARAWLMSIGY